MARRSLLILITLLCAACGGAREPQFPKEVPGGWKLFGSEEYRADTADASLQNSGLKRWLRARYDGPGYPDVMLYQMGSQASAFEMVQKWRSEKGVLVTHLDNIFVVYRTGLAPQEANKFAAAWEAAFKAM